WQSHLIGRVLNDIPSREKYTVQIVLPNTTTDGPSSWQPTPQPLQTVAPRPPTGYWQRAVEELFDPAGPSSWKPTPQPLQTIASRPSVTVPQQTQPVQLAASIPQQTGYWQPAIEELFDPAGPSSWQPTPQPLQTIASRPSVTVPQQTQPVQLAASIPQQTGYWQPAVEELFDPAGPSSWQPTPQPLQTIASRPPVTVPQQTQPVQLAAPIPQQTGYRIVPRMWQPEAGVAQGLELGYPELGDLELKNLGNQQ
uniref:Gamma-gliadin-like n=1 Tax=Nicotiana sylvestris TaxID=4096 RepID=A0A1U7VXH0_NICSY